MDLDLDIRKYANLDQATPSGDKGSENLNQICWPFTCLDPSKMKNLSKKRLRVGYVYIEISFDTILIMGYRWGRTLLIMGREICP